MKSRQRKVGHAPTRANKRERVENKPPEKSGAWRHMESCFPTGFPPTCRSASCASESKVSGGRRAGQKRSPAARRSDSGGAKEIRRQRVPKGE